MLPENAENVCERAAEQVMGLEGGLKERMAVLQCARLLGGRPELEAWGEAGAL